MGAMARTGRSPTNLVSSDDIRARFSAAVSSMFRREVPQYGALLDVVASVNRAAPASPHDDSPARLEVERHGAIRVGTPRELSTLRRIFAVMGMYPVGYYDLSVAGVPVHATAFRPLSREALATHPFRVFTSLLRLDLIGDPAVREAAMAILSARSPFSERALRLTDQFEHAGALQRDEADEFVREVLHAFRWRGAASVSRDTYRRLHEVHSLIADVACFGGPHINHLTPRTLDIDAVQREMPRHGIEPKERIEGPPRRLVPILLRQTSFKALDEPVTFAGAHDAPGTHTARFGEVEQRGMALTRKGRELYDRLLEQAHAGTFIANADERLIAAFQAFPDDLDEIRRAQLGFFRYTVVRSRDPALARGQSLDALVARGFVRAAPITYEDFLPVSAAGIFRSNLRASRGHAPTGAAARGEFETALGCALQDEFALYTREQETSIADVMQWLDSGVTHAR